jgi:hypothetical protein
MNGRVPCGNTAVIILTASQEFHATDIKTLMIQGQQVSECVFR